MKLTEEQVKGPFVRRPWTYCGIGRATFYRRVQAGVLPEGILQGSRVAVWPKCVLDDYMKRCALGMAGGEEVSA